MLDEDRAEVLQLALADAVDRAEAVDRGRAAARDRSTMNVCFDLPTADLQQRFLAEATDGGFSGLAGHRSIGGIRASIYNGLTLGAVEQLADFMEYFRSRQHA